MEDDYGMIDGILNNGQKEPTVAQLEQQARSGQPISLMDLAAAAHREEREKKKSVVEQLKSERKKTVDLRQSFRQKKLKDYADFFSSSSSLCCGVI